MHVNVCIGVCHERKVGRLFSKFEIAAAGLSHCEALGKCGDYRVRAAPDADGWPRFRARSVRKRTTQDYPLVGSVPLSGNKAELTTRQGLERPPGILRHRGLDSDPRGNYQSATFVGPTFHGTLGKRRHGGCPLDVGSPRWRRQ